MRQKEIINQSEENFNLLTGLNLEIESPPEESKKPDFIAVITDPITKKETFFIAEIKNELRATDTATIISRKKLKNKELIISQYISKPQRELLKNNKINYLDSSGNCFIHYKEFFVFIDNQKTQEQRTTKSNKILTEKGMRLIYALLLNKELINYNYRQIVKEVGIALGTVGNLLTELEQEGFILITENGRVLRNEAILLDKWASAYGTTLRPQLFQKRLRFVNREDLLNWKDIHLKNAFWGGEPAAYLLDKYLKPAEFIIYSEKTTTQLMKELKLVPDIGGEIILMLPPIPNKTEDKEMADPFLIYAELINSKDSRCLEAAQRIKEKYIDKR